MSIKIANKIVGYAVAKEDEDDQAAEAALNVVEEDTNVIHMHEKLERPEMLLGSTYKVKTPLSEHALYITINDVILNQDTDHELRRPFEVFINSKTWITSSGSLH